MDKGDFIVQFMDLTDVELSKPIDDLNPSRLESLMGLALRTSSAYNDPYKDSLKVQLFPYGIGDQLLTIIAIETPMERTDFPQVCNYKLPGAEGFSFSYDVKWPISLVLTPRVIVCYPLVFRPLFFCKHVERQLCNMWISSKGCVGTALSDQKDKAVVFALRQKMLNFVQNFQYYMAFEVIEPAWNAFLTTMQKVSNVDEVLECHLGMITSILDDSMLTIKVLLEKVTRILNLCLRFCKKISLMYSQNNFDAHIYEKICAADVKFSKMLVSFLKEVSEISQSSNKSNKVGNIIHRMNFNGYYTSSLEDSANTTQQPSSLSVSSLRKPLPSISSPFD
jgi:gamma-tubulin complex component 2